MQVQLAPSGQEVEEAPPADQYSYDANGNTIRRHFVNGSINEFEWDAANRLSAITYSGSGNRRTEFSYNGLNLWTKVVEKSGSTVTSVKQFVWNGSQLAEERDGSNNVTRRYFAQGEQRLGGADAGLYYYTRDHLGSVRELVDAGGALRARYDYDPFGNTSKQAGDLETDIGFTGHYRHAASNLYAAPFRFYDSTIGKWLSRDPIGEAGGINLYAYVGNNPSNLVDPLGLRDYSAVETRKILDAIKADASAGPYSGFFNMLANHTTAPYSIWVGYADFKARDKEGKDTYCVNGRPYRSDEFGNFAAGYAGEYYAGGFGVFLVEVGGIGYDFIDTSRPNWNRLDFDADSRADINAGSLQAKRELLPTR